MKRTFPLQIEGKKPERVLDSIKHEVRKYLKRERRRVLPDDTDYWDFDCKVGKLEEESEIVHLSTIIGHIDEAYKLNDSQIYIEIIAKAVKRKPKVISTDPSPDHSPDHSSDHSPDQLQITQDHSGLRDSSSNIL